MPAWKNLFHAKIQHIYSIDVCMADMHCVTGFQLWRITRSSRWRQLLNVNRSPQGPPRCAQGGPWWPHGGLREHQGSGKGSTYEPPRVHDTPMSSLRPLRGGPRPSQKAPHMFQQTSKMKLLAIAAPCKHQGCWSWKCAYRRKSTTTRKGKQESTSTNKHAIFHTKRKAKLACTMYAQI